MSPRSTAYPDRGKDMARGTLHLRGVRRRSHALDRRKRRLAPGPLLTGPRGIPSPHVTGDLLGSAKQPSPHRPVAGTGDAGRSVLRAHHRHRPRTSADANDPLSGYKQGGLNAKAYNGTGIDTRIRYDSSRTPPFTVMTSMPSKS